MYQNIIYIYNKTQMTRVLIPMVQFQSNQVLSTNDLFGPKVAYLVAMSVK
jgi:hypothetical protein